MGGKLPLVAGELIYHFRPAQGRSAEECIGHIAFENRKVGLHGTVAQSRWNSLEEHQTATVRDFMSYDRVMDVNPFEVADDKAARSLFARRARRAVKLLGIEGFPGRELLSLSNGETQRVHLARALSLPLRLLILDEPFIGLDAASRGFLNNVIEKLMRSSIKILLLTTRQDELPRGITHCLLLEECHVIAAGLKRDVLKKRRKLYRARPAMAFPKPSLKRRPNSNNKSNDILVDFRNVTVRYGSTTILDRINWTVRSGESWALLGPNGSGKTTLLSLILGDNPQVYANEVGIFGKPVGPGESMWERKRHIGWVSPELHVHFDDSIACREAVTSGFHDTIGLFEPETRRRKAVADRWLERFDLRPFANVPLFSLSIGLQRMVLLARALVKQPKLLILDEPCQGLDAAHRDLFLRVLNDLIASGTETAIYVTHRPEEIPASIRRVLRLEGGRVV